MIRSRLIIYVALAVAAILAIVFVAQLKQLRKQVRSSVRIVPGDSKSRENVAQQELEQGSAATRPDALVKFRSGVSSDAAKQIIARLNHEVIDEIEAVPGLFAIAGRESANTDPNADPMLVFGQYRALPEVEYAEPNYEINLNPPPGKATELTAHQSDRWAAKIGLANAWSKTKGSAEIVVGLLDGRVATAHFKLTNNVWDRPTAIAPYHDQDLGVVDDLHGYSAIADDSDSDENNEHGTSSAGIIGAECFNRVDGCGINPKTSIMPLIFLNDAGHGTVASAIEAINYAIDRKRAGVNIRVINAGWGLEQPSRALEDVIRSAGQAGILFVAASGNQGTDNDTKPYYPANYELENVISVAALGRNDRLASISNYGGKSVDIAAPGEGVLTTVSVNGDPFETPDTAGAAAVVTGVAALALSVNPELSVTQLRKLLLESVDKLPALRGKVATGGRINAAKAVK